ncbi:hypothetical protein [Oscillatoria salina]|uniref:hypothetical protein n=1 Tax=Oscillatoria salina TaxID=331517 RepID=UPI0013BBDAF7|nr:hypothetical protein [Oscillatoria salina]MBZ8181648.1 hypothetical protein [Oscillatoria salina IIICB1]NET88669.1 hypothetical protein [Kamptonema sp. SIO1D9]
MVLNKKAQAKLIIVILSSIFLSIYGKQPTQMGIKPAIAQFVEPARIASIIYERFPELPTENQYIRVETGEVDTDSTFISRLLSYHLYVKSRPPNFRLDWKLTIADYLDAHEYIYENQYPGYNTLQTNPLAGDRAIIENMTREERDRLINNLVSIFNPNATNNNFTPPITTEPTPQPTYTPPPRRVPTLPSPGAADLLKP